MLFLYEHPLLWGLKPGLRSIAAGLAREQPLPQPLPLPSPAAPSRCRAAPCCAVCALPCAMCSVLAVCRTRNMEGGTGSAAAFPGSRWAALPVGTAGAGAGSGLDGSHRSVPAVPSGRSSGTGHPSPPFF